jgi:hypothetical protein
MIAIRILKGLILTPDPLTAPAFEAVEYEMTKVDGVFDTISPYMGPGPEVDAAWDRLTWNTSSMCRILHYLYYLSADITLLSVKLIRLSDEDLKKLHKDGRPSNARFSEEDGGGSMGALNIVHLIHCVVRPLFAILNATLISNQ